MRTTLAVFGGSFDPPHVGHALVAAYVLASQPVDELVVVPVAHHAFDKRLTAFHYRLRMTELAFQHLSGAEVSDLEAQLGGESRTLRTLQALAARRPSARLRLVIGSDLVDQFNTWHRAREIAVLAPLLVVQRTGQITDPALPAMPEVSSTDLRARLREGRPTDGWLAPSVAAYARAHGLYR